ncbi:hypothetical protein AURDEDRAFT_79715 [Auricularia subglabra TFB-10046 SS5]|nr:hypothetical protein AURDEDRAFT_79715 [Auricularia subglabra TFB-10046 SS5]
MWTLASLKASSSMAMMKTACKIAFSLIPFSIMRMKLSEGILEHLTPAKEEHKDLLRRMSTTSGQMIGVMIWVPAIIIAVTMYACVEYTPITGRRRLIIFSPEEEETVAVQLEGMGWYNAIADILFAESSSSSPPRVIPVSDWRYIWAERVLRRLEAAVPHLQGNHTSGEWHANYPRPPPSEYPLEPRERIAQRLHKLVESGDPNVPAPHTLLGIPHNLLLVENEDESNGFSFGISGNGSSGIVVYSGFFDEIAPDVRPPSSASFLWRWLFPGRSHTDIPPITPEQTAKLAVLLAHELAHLVLAHHVETLSASSVLIPGLSGFWIDILRTLIYPWTMMWGPFLNDHLSTKTQEKQQLIRNLHAANFNRVFELEADIVSARILAYAGFDPRLAIDFWANRPCMADNEDEEIADGLRHLPERWWKHAMKTHPLREQRVQKLTREIENWASTRRGDLAERFWEGKPLSTPDVVG